MKLLRLSLLCLALLGLGSVPGFGQALTPVVTAASAATLVGRAAPGRLFKVFAANQTATAGFLVVLNLTAAPADGAVTPLACVPLPASGTANIDYPVRSAAFNTGVVVVLTSGANCFTKTTGVISGFISIQLE